MWQVTDQHQLSLGYTHSQRAPQIQELFSDGFHHATRSYELGNADLSKEISNNLDLGYRFNSNWMSAEINLFHNWVSDYIYQQRSATEPVLNTQQAAATFKGFEAQTIFPLMENTYGVLDLTLFGDYTRGRFDNGNDVPRMPPLRYGFQLSYEKDDFSSNLRFTRAEAQNNNYSATDTATQVSETDTKGYLLLNLQAQYRLASFHDSEVMLFAKGKNLLDENIRNSTSYLRNFSPEPSRSAELGLRINY
ncbi:TonB-dependent receptor (fragment) [Crenothrix polyspora]|uniref:TonB-dependent receptor n=1 Tax=Crenothrix polyspora TaxID=360316 RepID=A0A1R4H4K1_9GAMM